jgi:hypothetical protein
VKLVTGKVADVVTLMKYVPGVIFCPPEFVAFSLIDQLPTPNVYDTFLVAPELNQTTVLFPVTFWKDQFHAVGVFVLVSLNCTANGAVPELTFVVKLATGATTPELTLIYPILVEVLYPAEFDARNDTV